MTTLLGRVLTRRHRLDALQLSIAGSVPRADERHHAPPLVSPARQRAEIPRP